jgi:predicted anti-sigma-YlaC factor YlaD
MNLCTGSRASLMMSDHVSDLELELFRTGEAGEATGEHLELCEQCRDRTAFLLELATDQKLSVTAGEIPPEIDTEIIAMARRQSAMVRDRVRTRSVRRWVSAVAGAAAAVIIALMATMQQTDRRTVADIRRTDINTDGTVDILDALALAQLTGTAPAAGGDLNGDGRIDGRDVDIVVREAVSLREETSG